ncbi:MAG: hypothetical protein Q7T44_11940 [Parvibaculum sp.]|nr:hypothetical protein [Parvibaculum sp.]
MAEQDQIRKVTSLSHRRIVVGLDTSFMAREALALAARVAASVDANLRGIFVEDENLLALASLPFAREVSMSGKMNEIDSAEMLRAMQAQAQIAKRLLERVAGEAHVNWSFDVARGAGLTGLVQHTGVADTLVLRAQDASRHELGRTVRAATLDARADVLLTGRGVTVGNAFISPTTRPRSFGKTLASPVRPLLAVDEGSSLGETCVGFSQSLAVRIAMPFRRLFARGFSTADLASAARKANAGLIVVNAQALGDDDDAARLSAAARCPVLLLGGEHATLPADIIDIR